MHHDYSDIMSRIPEQPAWYDQNGVPRYGNFAPEMCPNIYADTIVLLAIACQACGQPFQVELSYDAFDNLRYHERGAEVPKPKEWEYGDPPVHGCVGDTMNSVPIAVLECWKHRKRGFGYRRFKSLEGACNCSWWKPEER